jgi:peroxiredoxin
VPDFSLPDQQGRTRTLQSIAGPRGAMLVFVRSADWCPFCRTQLVELQGRVDELRTQGLGLAAISYDSREILADFARRQGITFPLLSDVGSATIRKFGILNTVAEAALGPSGKDPSVLADVRVYATAGEATERLRGIPFPGTFVVDRQGRVTSRFFEDYYWERNTTSTILLKAGIGDVPLQATAASTRHLDLRTFPSDAVVSIGTRFSLAVEITPKPGMHLYAPGANNYQVIDLTVDAPPNVRVTPLRYPKSEIYHFVPLNERVPVYSKPFTLTLDIVPEATAEGRKALAGQKELMLSGTLSYQACDDKLCYNPASLPLTWKVELRPAVAGAPSPATR